MIPISVCIITKNEAENLQRCLEALKPYPFEIVVVDTGSQDSSLDIAKKYTDNVYEFPWINDFAAARNFAADCASHDMIFPVDTDEIITSLDLNMLQSAISAHPKSVGFVKRLDYFETGSGIRHYDVMIERIYNRRYYHYERPIHEVILPIVNVPYVSYETSVVMDHVGYLGDKEKLQQKADRNLILLKKEIEKSPDDPYPYFQTAQCYLLMRNHAQACEYFAKSISLNPPPTADYTRTLVNNYGSSLIELDRPAESIRLLAYYEYYENNVDYLCMIGLSYMLIGQPLRALPEFIKALSAPTRDSVDPRSPSYYVGYLYEFFGKNDIAKTHYQNCGDYPPAVDALERLS